MRAIVSTAVAVAIALHAVLGCCWHHSHTAVANAVEPLARQESVESAKQCLCHHHRSDVPEKNEEHSEGHHSDDSCPTPCNETCYNAAVSRAHQDDVTTLVPSDFLPSVDQPMVSCVLVAANFDSPDETFDPPPLRLHLLYQLLLI